MVSGDGSGQEEAGGAGGSAPGGEAPAPPGATARRGEPAVELRWLGRRLPRPRRGPLPRLSTLLLLAAFIAVLVLYLMVQPS